MFLASVGAVVRFTSLACVKPARARVRVNFTSIAGGGEERVDYASVIYREGFPDTSHLTFRTYNLIWLSPGLLCIMYEINSTLNF